MKGVKATVRFQVCGSSKEVASGKFLVSAKRGRTEAHSPKPSQEPILVVKKSMFDILWQRFLQQLCQFLRLLRCFRLPEGLQK